MKTILSIARRYASVEGWGDLEDRTSASAINLRADVAPRERIISLEHRRISAFPGDVLRRRNAEFIPPDWLTKRRSTAVVNLGTRH
jgi:hypothetical protein